MKKELITLADRLIDARENRRWKKADLRRAAGLKSASTLTELENGTIKESPQLPKIANALGVEVLWLQHGTHPRSRQQRGRENLITNLPGYEGGFTFAVSDEEKDLLPSQYIQTEFIKAESNAEEAPAIRAGKRVPVVGTAQLGDNGYWAELETPVGHGDGYIPFPVKTSNAYALRCCGDSMKPRIKDGEFVIVEPEAVPSPGDEVLVKSTDGRVMVKELLYIREGVVHLLSVNEAHGKLAIPLVEIECMHFVTAIAKRSMWEPD